MHVHFCVQMCLRFLCIHVCLRVHVYLFMCVCVRIYMRAFVYTCVCACQCLHVYVSTCISCVCMRVCVLIVCVFILEPNSFSFGCSADQNDIEGKLTFVCASSILILQKHVKRQNICMRICTRCQCMHVCLCVRVYLYICTCTHDSVIVYA